MTQRKLYKWFISLLVVLFMIIEFSFHPVLSQIPLNKNKSKIIDQEVTNIVKDKNLPGMIAAISSNEGILAIGSAGVRKVGHKAAFTNSDLVHLASCTKAMTCVMLATLVEEGKLSWDMKLIDAIPELKNIIHADFHTITLWQLLTHQAGLQKNIHWGAYKKTEIKERRLKLLRDNLKTSAYYTIGEYHYSNFGYMVAACMAEQTTNTSWENLMQDRVFDPLEMTTAGFGATCSGNSVDQPWGHEKLGGEWKPSDSYNSESLGPAGRIHCNIYDWAKFLSLFLKEINPILDKESITKLMTPTDFYAGGWGVDEPDWAKGSALMHSGFIGIWYCSVIVTPNLNRAFIVATNSGDYSRSGKICDTVLSKLIELELNASN